ncbi:protein kinase inhibitor [Schizosaccharomyces cryophilus OY26]|uniref:Protein kinase inhibitor n=1 Tax=Schizosaccharomyces cryophilus (strain OY26 / ATCC MYA-4695 / CBS 11777 / NBRC 106824 / NRRL Y48691) TaxID=653667 RepID=S9VVA3_SCHCR|nr:protein kinase inhibitor [Schizosaccharomyces cryophilus OY26]EPY50005.1 protein kinase inhibitor [Schizosaccharomyces cryophilus OY26]
MHRSYSLRNSRAPTASQLMNPPPPVSSARNSRSFTPFRHSMRIHQAVNFSPDLAKRLAVLVKMEKNVMASMVQVTRGRRDAARQLSYWGEDCDDDISDVTDKLGVLFYEVAELENYLIDRHDQYRVTLKSIRNIEASVQPSREKKQKLLDHIYMLKHKDPESPKLVTMEQELVREEAACLVAEAQLSNTTREKFKQAMTYNLDALHEHAEKLGLITAYGRHLLNLIDDAPVTPGEARPAYDGYETSRQIIMDAEHALSTWIPAHPSVNFAKPQEEDVQSDARSWNDYEAQGEPVPVQQMTQMNDSQSDTSEMAENDPNMHPHVREERIARMDGVENNAVNDTTSLQPKEQQPAVQVA